MSNLNNNTEYLQTLLEMANSLPYANENNIQADWNQNDESASDYIKNKTHWIEDDGETYHPLDEKFIPKTIATKDYVESLYTKLTSNTVLGFYCIEDVTIVINDISTTYPANSNVEIRLTETDVFEIIPTSDKSILSLNAFPGALDTFYPWLEGVAQFSNILFDMNAEDMYTKWNQGNQGLYHVQSAQYTNCIFWSDNPYVSDVSKRTNYTLTHTSQLPLCYSTIPENTFKSFYLAWSVNNDPNWANEAYVESFANANWATQVFSYYGARMIGTPGLYTIALPTDCRGLMFYAEFVEYAGTFDAINTTTFGAKSGSWRDAFGHCGSLKRLYIKNLKVNLNLSWSPIDYDSINYIVSEAANTNAITISVSPYTYNLLSQSDFDLAASRNITIELLASNYVEDKRFGKIANKADIAYVDEQIANLVNSAPETLDTIGELATALQEHSEVAEVLNNAIAIKADKTYVEELISNIPTESDVLIIDCPDGSTISHTFEQIITAINNNKSVYASIYGSVIAPLSYIADDNSYIDFHTINTEINENQLIDTKVDSLRINNDNTFVVKYNEIALKSDLSSKANTNEVLLKTAQTLTNEELTQVRKNLKFIGQDVEGQTFTINGKSIVASPNAEIFGDYVNNKCTGQWSIVEGSANVATGRACHVEGAQNQALNDGCHVEGVSCIASGYWSHAEGEMTRVTSYASHAEGSYTKMPDGTTRYGTASGYASHIEGGGCHAEASCSHSEGLATTAKGNYSHSEGRYTIAGSPAQHVEGVANIEDAESKYIHIAGNGDWNVRSNAYTLDWEGNGWFSGDVYVGSTSGTNKDDGSNKLATEKFVSDSINNQTTEEWVFTLQDGSTVTKRVVLG